MIRLGRIILSCQIWPLTLFFLLHFCISLICLEGKIMILWIMILSSFFSELNFVSDQRWQQVLLTRLSLCWVPLGKCPFSLPSSPARTRPRRPPGPRRRSSGHIHRRKTWSTDGSDLRKKTNTKRQNILVSHFYQPLWGPYIKYRNLGGRVGWWIAVSISNGDVMLFSNNEVILQSEGGGGSGAKKAQKLRS